MTDERATDRVALRRLIDAYASAVDGADPDACAALFTPEGVLCRANDPGERFTRRGRDEIATAMRGLSRYESTSHRLGNQQITFGDDDRAHGVTACEAHHISAEGDGTRTDKVMTIRYRDTYRRNGSGGWLIEERCLFVEREEIRDQRGTESQ